MCLKPHGRRVIFQPGWTGDRRRGLLWSMLGSTNNVPSTRSLQSMASSAGLVTCFDSTYWTSGMLAWGVISHGTWTIDPGWGQAFSISLQGSRRLWRHRPPQSIAVAGGTGCAGDRSSPAQPRQQRFVASSAPRFSWLLLLRGRQTQHWPSGLSLEGQQLWDNQR